MLASQALASALVANVPWAEPTMALILAVGRYSLKGNLSIVPNMRRFIAPTQDSVGTSWGLGTGNPCHEVAATGTKWQVRELHPCDQGARPPCRGEGRWFESRRPLAKNLVDNYFGAVLSSPGTRTTLQFRYLHDTPNPLARV